MKPEIKERWVSALRSGKYSQVTGELTDGRGFCCLGVLCEIAIADGVVIKDDNDTSYKNPYDWSDSSYGELPDAVVEWAGLNDSNPDIESVVDDHDATLSELNDDYGWDFSNIADVIEKQL